MSFGLNKTWNQTAIPGISQALANTIKLAAGIAESEWERYAVVIFSGAGTPEKTKTVENGRIVEVGLCYLVNRFPVAFAAQKLMGGFLTPSEYELNNEPN